jgi:hypothetical protein
MRSQNYKIQHYMSTRHHDDSHVGQAICGSCGSIFFKEQPLRVQPRGKATVDIQHDRGIVSLLSILQPERISSPYIPRSKKLQFTGK